MRVLITGANGFIGAHIVARLLGQGHAVVAAVRAPDRIRRRFPTIDAVHCDLNRDVAADAWLPRLAGVDAVVNCAGALQTGGGQNLDAIHHRAPAALFDACAQAGVRTVVHISAISADPAAGTDYARSKAAGEASLKTRDLDWVILRPSLVYAEGSYGGTSLLRALAVLPLLTPLPGRGDQLFQPIHARDLAETVAVCLSRRDLAGSVLEPVGPEPLTVKDILAKLRAWLGYRAAPCLPVPMPVIAGLARVGDLFGAGPVRTTTVRQMLHGNTGDPAPFIAATGLTPRTMDAALSASPAGTQDRWHARLFFVGPLLRVALAAFWIWTGVTALLRPPRADALALLELIGLDAGMIAPTIWFAAALDIGLGAWLLVARSVKRPALAMLAVGMAYLAAFSVVSPTLWLDPYGVLSKIPVILVATLVLMVLGEDR